MTLAGGESDGLEDGRRNRAAERASSLDDNDLRNRLASKDAVVD